MAQIPQLPKLRTKRKIIVSLHGIRTRGTWQKDLSPLITEQGWIYYPLDFGWYSVLLFIPWFFRERKIEWFRSRYREIRSRYPDVVPSIIAHSFGTWIFCKAIEKYEHLQFDKVILCGCIAKSDFDWDRAFAQNQLTAVRNDCGKKDIWARFSKWFAWGTGDAGYRGFTNKALFVHEKIYQQYDHGSIFGWDHYLGEWVPFLAQPMSFSNGEVPWEFEEPISPYDAARWSAITYFKQYISRAAEAIQRNEVFLEPDSGIPVAVQHFKVLIPRTPGEASAVATARYYSTQNCRRVKFGHLSARTGHLSADDCLCDIPTTVNSLLELDHRTNEELVDAVNEFAAMLQRKIDDPASDVRGMVTIVRI